MSNWKDDPVQRGIYEGQDRVDDEKAAKDRFEIEKGFMDGNLLGVQIEVAKARVRARAESYIHKDLEELLEKIETCPGFMRLSREDLEAGRSGLLSEWYKRLQDIPLGSSKASRQLHELEKEVRRFRDWLASRGPFPEQDAWDRIGTKLDLRFDLSTLSLPPSWRHLDFSHLTRSTADSLDLCLDSIAIRLFSLRSVNENML